MTALGIVLLLVVTLVFSALVVASAMLAAVGETLGRGVREGLEIHGDAVKEWAALRTEELAPPSRRLA